MDQYGNLGPYQDPKVRQWFDELEVGETADDENA